MREMRFVERDESGKVVGHYANEQTYAREQLPDDHPDIKAWEAAREAAREAAKQNSPQVVLERRVAELEAKLAKLTGGE